jgi:hypothetical protein
MENFFNYISKPVSSEDVDVWLRINNIIPEKLELFKDFVQSLNMLIEETYLGEHNKGVETTIRLSSEDNKKHFEWCFNKVIENFHKEKIDFKKKGEHFDYFKVFFDDVFYNQKEENIRKSVSIFFLELFDLDKPFTKSDLDMIGIIYKMLDKNLSKSKK